MVYSAILCLGEQFVILGEVNQKAPPAYHLLEMSCRAEQINSKPEEEYVDHTLEVVISQKELAC